MNFQVDKGWKYQYHDLPKIKSEEDIDSYVKEAEKYFPRWTRGIYNRHWNNNKFFDSKGVQIKFSNDLLKKKWEFELLRRCEKGHDGIPGKMYFYFHFCSIKNISGGFIRPDFRVSDIIWYHILESCEWTQYNRGQGVLCVKRRRGGFSWKQASDSLHDALFKEGFRIGMTSKDEAAAKDLMTKVYQMYERLPTFLKHPFSSKTQETFVLARKDEDDLGQRTLSGNESEIYCKAPTDSCFEGEQIGKMVVDEVGKISNIETIWSMGVPTLMEETKRVGIPVLFGTAGEQTKVGVGQKEFWNNHEIYDLVRFFFPGWAGLMSSKDGNDDIKGAVKWILKEREKLAKLDNAKKLLEFKQQYPLWVEEAFISKGGTGIGNMIKISQQLSTLEEKNSFKKEGRFRWGRDNEAKVVFEPNSHFDDSGKCVIYEEPHSSLDYESGCDPADHDFVQKGASKLSMYIGSHQKGTRPPKIVFSYTDRPERVNDYYEQSIMALLYFNSPKILIENNRFGMIKHYEDTGYLYLLKPEPIAINRLNKIQSKQLGVRKTVQSTREMERCINHYTDDFCDLIPDKELLEEFLVYGESNTDRAIAFGWLLVSLEDSYQSKSSKEDMDKALPKTRIRKINGRLVRIKK